MQGTVAQSRSGGASSVVNMMTKLLLLLQLLTSQILAAFAPYSVTSQHTA